MKSENIIDAIGKIDDEYILEARNRKAVKRKPVWEYIGKFAVAACSIALVVSLASGAVSMGKMYDYKSESADYAYSVQEEYEVNNAFLSSNGTYNALEDNDFCEKKIIVTGDMSLETLDLDASVENLISKVNEYGGYLQSSSTFTSLGYYSDSHRYYSAVIRIPCEKYQEFIDTLGENDNVSSYSESREDITDTYTDLSAKLANYKAEEARIVELYNKASSITEIMEIEDKLTDIRYNIDSISLRLKNYDVVTEYSTLNLNISETVEYRNDRMNFFERIGQAFIDGFVDFFEGVSDFFVGVIYYLWVIVLAAIGYIAYRIIRKRRKKGAIKLMVENGGHPTNIC